MNLGENILPSDCYDIICLWRKKATFGICLSVCSNIYTLRSIEKFLKNLSFALKKYRLNLF